MSERDRDNEQVRAAAKRGYGWQATLPDRPLSAGSQAFGQWVRDQAGLVPDNETEAERDTENRESDN